MVQLRRWLDRVRLRWDLSVMKKQHKWGDSEETIEFLLGWLTPERIAAIPLPVLKHTLLFTRSVNVDVLVQMIQRARWVADATGDQVVREETYKQVPIGRSLDTYLVTALDVPIRADTAVARLKEDLLPLMQQLLLLDAEAHENAEYYRRQFSWLYNEVREFLQALVLAIDPKIEF